MTERATSPFEEYCAQFFIEFHLLSAELKRLIHEDFSKKGSGDISTEVVDRAEAEYLLRRHIHPQEKVDPQELSFYERKFSGLTKQLENLKKNHISRQEFIDWFLSVSGERRKRMKESQQDLGIIVR